MIPAGRIYCTYLTGFEGPREEDISFRHCSNYRALPTTEAMSDARASAAQTNRRLYPRYEVALPIEILVEDDAGFLSLRTANLSLCGCSIVLDRQLAVGSRVQATLQAGGDLVVVHGRVITRHPQFGNGIMFLRFVGDGEERLRRYLESL